MTVTTPAFDALEYWEKRHVTLAGDLRNVGNRGLTAEQNRDLITKKANLICHTLGKHGVPRGARILDAGCGAGFFTELLQQTGFTMQGIDGSPSAIADARKTGDAAYEVAVLSSYKPGAPFDVVLCLDVLFHVVEQDEWIRSVSNLAACVGAEGLLMFIETFDHTGLGSAPHVRWRHRDDYVPVLAGLGFGIVDDIVFQYPHERVNKTLAVAQRRG